MMKSFNSFYLLVPVIAFLLLGMMVIEANAQPDTLWTQTFGGSYSDEGHSVQQTSDGGYIIAGNSWSFGAGGCDVYLIKTDASGNEQWNQTFDGNLTDEGHSVQQTADGGFIITGYTYSYGAGDYDVLLIKTDASGMAQWIRTFGGIAVDYGYSVQQTSDGGYIIAGWTMSFGAGSSDVYLIKTDASGIEQWSQTFGGSNGDEGQSVQQTSDGGYIIAGYTWSYGAGEGDVYLIKTDASGNPLWNQAFGGSNDDKGYSVQQTSDGGYITAGNTRSYGAGDYDVYLIKTDATGNEQWNQTFGGSHIDQGHSVQQTDDGGFIITGYTWSFGAGSSDVYLIKTDESGDTLWTKTCGGSSSDEGHSVQQTGDGGYIIAGDTWSYGAGNSDVWLIRLEGETTPPDVMVTLTPYNPPILIPASGGSFDFNIELTNTIPMGFEVDVWTMATLPNGSQFGPIINVDAFPLSGSSSVNRDRTQMVPANAPTGNYTYDAYVGTYPNDPWDEDHFDFEKLASGDGANPVAGWACWGEPFESAQIALANAVTDYALLGAYPNPFNPATTLSYALPKATRVNLTVYNISGSQVTELINGWRDAGNHEVTFDGSNLTSGVYVYRIKAGEFTASGKMVLMK